MRKALIVAVVVLVLGGATAAAAQVPAPAPVQVRVAPDPVVPYEPVTFTVSGGGCAPGTPVRVQVGHNSQLTDYVMLTPSATTTVDADGAGSWSATLSFPVAYPGGWMVAADEPMGTGMTPCARYSSHIEVPTPPGMGLSVQPRALVQGRPTSLTVSGTGCRGDRVQWELGPSPLVLAGRTVPTAADGSWESTVTVTAEPPRPGLMDLHLSAWCVFGDDPAATDVVTVGYPDRAVVKIEPPSPTTTTTTTTTVPRPVHPLLALLRRIVCALFRLC